MSRIQKKEMHSYKGRRFAGWGKATFVLLLVGVLVFGALEIIVLSGGRTQINVKQEIMVIFG